MLCTKCGQQIPDYANFCTRCGAPQRQINSPNQYGTIEEDSRSLDQRSDDQKVVDAISLKIKIDNTRPFPEPLPPDEYAKMREFEVQWLESHYDFNSIDGINAIPVSEQLQRPPTTGVTGEVYYYMRKKAHQHEDAGDIDLAIACLRKANRLERLQYGKLFTLDNCYQLVRLLARAGYVSDAIAEKNALDRMHYNDMRLAEKERFSSACQLAAQLGTDLLIMDAHAATCPECARYQGRVYSISGSNRVFPRIPAFILANGCVHEGCNHTFSAYIHGVDDPQIDYTLSLHPLINRRYGRNIITFSNRPFVDDRTEECKRLSANVLEKLRIDAESKKLLENQMVEIEAQKGQDIRNFKWLQEHIPEKCPKSISGYRRMKNQNTKNYQSLKQLAAKQGKIL